jgi:rubrerythrin
MTRAMETVLDHSLEVHEPEEWRGFGDSAYRCPRCGGLEHTDSAIPGACPICPGLVPLQRA